MVAVTLDALPHVGSLSPRIYYGLGYGGRGLVPSHIIGRLLARRAMGEAVAEGPFGDAGFRPLPLHGLRRPVMQLAAGWWEILDRREAHRK
jgi:glycine/D-amino acid oxidase-like deaminating enzyme